MKGFLLKPFTRAFTEYIGAFAEKKDGAEAPSSP